MIQALAVTLTLVAAPAAGAAPTTDWFAEIVPSGAGDLSGWNALAFSRIENRRALVEAVRSLEPLLSAAPKAGGR